MASNLPVFRALNPANPFGWYAIAKSNSGFRENVVRELICRASWFVILDGDVEAESDVGPCTWRWGALTPHEAAHS